MKQILKIIDKYEIAVRFIIIVGCFLMAYYSEPQSKQAINVVGFTIAFLISLYLHKHFFPFVSIAVACYAVAAGAELWGEQYAYTPLTIFFWNAGNLLMPIGFISFLYRIYYKFKNVSDEDK